MQVRQECCLDLATTGMRRWLVVQCLVAWEDTAK